MSPIMCWIETNGYAIQVIVDVWWSIIIPVLVILALAESREWRKPPKWLTKK